MEESSQSIDCGLNTPMLNIIYHSNCFDGLASAALFARFYREAIDSSRPLAFTPTRYTCGKQVDTTLLRSGPGVENAIVDFKYSADPRVSWWFDHHEPESTFPTPAERRHYDERPASALKFYDASYPSCARLIAAAAETRSGWSAPECAELVEWADHIDAGTFDEAAVAVELRHVALRLGLVILHTHDDLFAESLIGRLAHRTLASILADSDVASKFPALERAHYATVEAVRARAVRRGDVLYYDVANLPYPHVDRYIPFYLDPDVPYSVGLSRGRAGLKVAVSYNPWSPQAQGHSIARVCELHGPEVGGGGREIIGGITLGHDAYQNAVEKAAAVCTTLNEPPSAATVPRTVQEPSAA